MTSKFHVYDFFFALNYLLANHLLRKSLSAVPVLCEYGSILFKLLSFLFLEPLDLTANPTSGDNIS